MELYVKLTKDDSEKDGIRRDSNRNRTSINPSFY